MVASGCHALPWDSEAEHSYPCPALLATEIGLRAVPAQLNLRSLGSEHFQARATSSDNSRVRMGRWIQVGHWQNQPYVQNHGPGLNNQEEQSGEHQRS